MKKRVFKSKIGPEFILILAAVFGTVLSIAFVNGHAWSTLGIISPVILFMMPILFATSYTITGNDLEIRSGFFHYQKINIHHILNIRSSRSWQSSPAISLDRLEIFYTKYDSVLISPKNKRLFVDELLKIAPGIDVDLKKA